MTDTAQTGIEQAVIGAIILEQSAFSRIADILKPEDFTDPNRKRIFKAVQLRFEKSIPYDIVSIGKASKSPEIMLELTECSSRLASTANLEHHAMVLVQSTIGRELPGIASQALLQSTNDVADGIIYLQDEITRLMSRMRAKRAKHVRVSVPVFANSVIDRKKAYDSGAPAGLAIGIKELDRELGGIFPGTSLILAGRPGMGKTAVAVAIALSIAKRGTPVGFLSLEMTEDEILSRFVGAESGVMYSAIQKGELNDSDLENIGYATAKVKALPIVIDDEGGIDVLGFRAKCKQMVDNHGVKLIILDYLQLVKNPKIKFREEAIADVSRTIKETAKSLNVTMLSLAQLNREVEKTPDKKPTLSHLRESGQIEQDADGVLMLYRPEYYGIEDYEGTPTKDKLWICQEKYRQGRAGIDYIVDCEIATNRIGWEYADQVFKNRIEFDPDTGGTPF